MTNEELVTEVQRLGEYIDTKMLEDGTVVAIGNLLFTRAIYMDCDLYGWGRRFCFEDKARADREYAKLTSGEVEPTGWIARR